jgi:hypothetical protein
MPDQQCHIEILRSTSALLMAIRNSIAITGNADAMYEIDSLVAVAQSETNRRLAGLTSRGSGFHATKWRCQ